MKFRQNIYNRTLLSLTLALCLIFASGLNGNISYADVIDGQPLEKSLISLKDIYDHISEDKSMTSEEYRGFFKDMTDTADAFHTQAIHDRDLLSNVTDILLKEKDTLEEGLESYNDILLKYGELKKMYDPLMDKIMSASTPEIIDGMTVYRSANENLSRFVLKKSSGGFYYLYDASQAGSPLCAATNKANYSTYYHLSEGVDRIMISYSTNGIYRGSLNDTLQYEGFGTLYKNTGVINRGSWIDGELSGTAYIYDKRISSSNTAQFTQGKRNGMTIFQEEDQDNIYTRVYEDNKLEGPSYTKLYSGDSFVDLLTYYSDDEQLPIRIALYPDGSYNISIKSGSVPVIIYHSDELKRTFIGATENNIMNGFGYGIIEDIEYIGQFRDFNIAGGGTYYQVDDTENVFGNKVQSILDEKIRDDMSDAQKIKIIHDYLVGSILYHHPGAAIDAHPGYTHTAYGAIVYGRAVCDGYAQAFKTFLDIFGIENEIIFGVTADGDGTFADGNNHAWNLVKVGDKYLHFDLTWNDPTYSSKIRHVYYMMESDEIKRNHRWDEEAYAIYLDQ